MPGATFDLASMEPLLDDARVEKIAQKIRSEFAGLADSDFVTFIVPERTVERKLKAGIAFPHKIEPMAVFAIISDNPRPYAKATGQRLLTSATASLKDWREAEAERGHYVGGPDLAHDFFRRVAPQHVELIQNLKDLTN